MKIRTFMTNPAYEFSIGLIAILCGINLMLEIRGATAGYHHLIDQVIYSIFVVDYFVGLWAATNRRHYMKTHVVELISIIPFSIWFQSARLLQVIRFMRAIIAFKRSLWHFHDAFAKYDFLSSFVIVVVLVLVGGVSAFLLEPDTFKGDWVNGIWWAVVTATTVGYGDYFPISTFGRVIAVLLMLLGTAFVGIFSGMLAGYYVSRRTQEDTDPWKATMIEQIGQLEKLDDEQRERLIRMIETYQTERSNDSEDSKEQK